LHQGRPIWRVREAGVDDALVLAALRRRLFEAMGYRNPELLAWFEETCAAYFRRAIPAGEFRAWVVEAQGKAVASGGLVLHPLPPSPRNQAGKEGYIMSLYALPEWRRRGIATAILRAILDRLVREGVPMASLHATGEGVPLYTREGFEKNTETRLLLSVWSERRATQLEGRAPCPDRQSLPPDGPFCAPLPGERAAE